MTIHEFKTQAELDAEAERYEELAFEHLYLKEAVEDAREELEWAERELEEFEKNHNI